MAWFLNHYTCARCGHGWIDEWSCMCDDDCPLCGARHMSPVESDDLTYVIEQEGTEFFVRWSPETAGHCPQYCELATFPTRAQAEKYLTTD